MSLNDIIALNQVLRSFYATRPPYSTIIMDSSNASTLAGKKMLCLGHES